MLNFLLAYIMMVVVYSELIGSIFRCPTKTERRLFQSHRSCQNNAVYHCIRDERNALVETCNEPKLIPKGNFPIYLHKSDRIYYTNCPKDLYQPVPIWSSEISDCEYKKSACDGIGQVICGIGNATEDVTCGCDFKRGFAINGQNRCCSPSMPEECYCQYRICENTLQQLDKDYNCKNECMPGYEKSVHNTCEPKLNISRSTPHEDVSTTDGIEFWQANTNREFQFKSPLGFRRLAILGCAFCSLMMLIVMFNYLSRPRLNCCKYLLCTGFCLFILILFVIVMVIRWFYVGLVLIILVFVGTTCYVVYSLYVYEMIFDPEVYNEQYEERIFRLLNAASMNDVNEFKRLSKESYIDMDDVDINGRSALHLAACENQKKVVDYIVKKHFCFPGAKDRWNRSAKDDAKWHQSQHSGSSYNYTIHKVSSYSNQHYRRNEWKKKIFFKETKANELVTAASEGDILTIKRLHEMKTDMNLANSIGRTALHAAFENGRTNIVEYLIDMCEVSPFVRCSGRRPIEIIPTDELDGILVDTMIAKLQCYMTHLLEYTPEAASVEEIPSLEIMIVRLLNCASKGDIKQMKRFQASGYKMDVRNYDSQTALHIAVLENQEHIVDFLLKKCKQADIALTARDRWHTTPWEAAKKSALQSVKYVFFDNCPETLEADNDAIKTLNLLKAASEGNLSMLKSLHQENFDMNKQDHNGKTALHFAATANKTKAVRFLVHVAKVDILIPDRYNILPMDGDIHENIKNILKNYQNSTKKEQNELKTSTQEETLMLVMKACSKGILHKQNDPRYKYFNMDNCNYDGDTPLHVAAANGKLEDVLYLLHQRKACLFVRNGFWKRPIDVVRENITFLSARESQSINETILKQLCFINDLIYEAMNDAMHQNVFIDGSFEKRSKEEKLFLFQNRIFKGDVLAIRRFLKTDATLINQLDYDDRSALHIAAAAGHTELVKCLLNQRADKYNKDRYNVTSLDEAKIHGDYEMINMLKDYN